MDTKSLHIVHAAILEDDHSLFIFDEFCNTFHLQIVGNVDDMLNYGSIPITLFDISDKYSIDLQDVSLDAL